MRLSCGVQIDCWMRALRFLDQGTLGSMFGEAMWGRDERTIP